MTYRYVAASVEGFIQQLAVAYVARGYWFYVSGVIPPAKDPGEVDRKLLVKYGIDLSRWDRARRKKAGYANVHYLRHERFFVLIATPGQHPFFQHEANLMRDCRRCPILYAGYAISYRGGHAHVRIEQKRYQGIKAYLLDLAPHLPTSVLEAEFIRSLRFAPFAPVRSQMQVIWRKVNDCRKRAGLPILSRECLKLGRRPVRPFGD